MNNAFTKLSNTDLRALVVGLRLGKVASPYSKLQLSPAVSSGLVGVVRDGLIQLENLGFTREQIAAALELIEQDRKNGPAIEPPIDLVTSGPEAPGITNRDTSVVVRELFSHAKQSVLVVGYAVYQGQQVFESLAQRMEQLPDLDVQFFLNVPRPDRDKSLSEILVAKFRERFKTTQWPAGCRLPAVYYDPRSVADEEPVRSSLHAKCVVVDAKYVFVSSANFTEAGQERNIEVGLKIESEWLARQLIRHFKLLHEHGLAVRAF